MKFSVVIVNYNVKYYLEQCLCSLYREKSRDSQHVDRDPRDDARYGRGELLHVVEAAGIKDIRTKCLRSNNPANVVAATMEGLKSLRNAQQVAVYRGKTAEEILG